MVALNVPQTTGIHTVWRCLLLRRLSYSTHPRFTTLALGFLTRIGTIMLNTTLNLTPAPSIRPTSTSMCNCNVYYRVPSPLAPLLPLWFSLSSALIIPRMDARLSSASRTKRRRPANLAPYASSWDTLPAPARSLMQNLAAPNCNPSSCHTLLDIPYITPFWTRRKHWRKRQNEQGVAQS